jgi:hypothetical protein
MVIVIGILLAFQVEEWRDEWSEQRDVAAAMVRLMEETEENIERCGIYAELLKTNALSVQHVFRSLIAGEIYNDDHAAFEQGLINFDVVPDVRMLTSVANEMISTGLLKELDDSKLRGSIARLPALDSESRDLLPYWRTPIIELSSEMDSLVDFYYEGDVPSLDRDNPLSDSTESSMRVNYDFDRLASNQRIRNSFFEAVDVHADVWFGFRDRCNVVKDIKARLEAAIKP